MHSFKTILMARRTMTVLAQWSSRIFSVERGGRTPSIYFSLKDCHEKDEAPELFRHFENARCYSLIVCTDNRIQRAKFHWALKDKLFKELPRECEIFAMCSFLPNVKDSLLKGYFVKDAPECSSQTERVLSDLTQNGPVLTFSYTPHEGGRLWSQQLWSHADGQSSGAAEKYVVPTETPDYHPSTLNIVNSDVFYSYQDAYQILQECRDIIPESTAVLDMVDQRNESLHELDFPVVVIEGLDATGKTTLTESLRVALGATLLRSPPQCLSPWRARFDQEPPLIRRAFYALGNYITAQQIGQEARRAPVIVDRYWHSTAAYAIATAVDGPVRGLPAEGSEVYRWPGDLLQPSLAVLLTLDPEERRRRLRGRGQLETQEEQALAHNQLFRLRVEEAYRRISGPTCVTVDASPSADQVLQQVLLLIKDKCRF